MNKDSLAKIKHVALDMDGTIYLGNKIFPYTLDFLKKLDDLGIGYSFLTNNPTKSIQDYLSKLSKMGIVVGKEKMYTTAIATIDYIKSHYPKAKKLFLLGTDSMIKQFEDAGFISCKDSADDVPDVLVVAFDTNLIYSRLCRATWWAYNNIPYIATNPDKVCPTNEKTILVDCGSIQKCIEEASGRRPDIVLGKPDPNMLSGICQRNNLKADEIAMVGDRLYTDVAMAKNAGAFGVLTLSGETTREILNDAVRKDISSEPDLVVNSIEEFGQILEKYHKN